MKRLVVLFLLAHSLLFAGLTLAQTPTTVTPIYISPIPGSRLVSAGTTIALRQGETLDVRSLSNSLFSVVGEKSGIHSGAVVLADDRRTVIFKPTQSFALGERVNVTIRRGILTSAGDSLGDLNFVFTITPNDVNAHPHPPSLFDPDEAPANPNARALAPSQAAYQFLSAPSDLPGITVTTPATNTGDGYIFSVPLHSFAASSAYLMIYDDNGQPLFYKKTSGLAFDFKKQPGGLLTYWEGGAFKALDSSYNLVDTFQAGNGYYADVHDFQLLPNGHSLLLIYDYEPVDMSQIVSGGYPTATVVGLVVQELDSVKNVVFQWRSWDHFNITDTYENLIAPTVDYVHGNAIEPDTDGNILISSRHLAEVTKINRATGDIIWRLGGKNNEFTFTNDISPSFYYQHDIRRLPNGDLTLFNNRTGLTPTYSEAKEYQIDEASKMITQVWSFTDTPTLYAFAMGDVQRLANGNSFIGWGAVGTLTEVHPDGSKALEFQYTAPDVSYRAFRFPWHGYPNTLPTLVAQVNAPTTTLAFSWNGATDISAYRVYGGNSPPALNLITTTVKSGFENQLELVDTPYCYFRVMPLDNNGWATTYSNDVFTCAAQIRYYLPSILESVAP